MHPTHTLHFKIKVMCQVKVKSKVKMQRFYILGYRVGWMGRKELQTHQKCYYSLRMVLYEYYGHI